MFGIRQFGILVSILGFCQAWWFLSRDDPILQPQTGIEQSCLNTEDSVSCESYRCVQRRFPCLPHSFALNHGHFYCDRFRDNLEHFNEAGRDWVRRSQACMATAMLNLYRLPSATCSTLNGIGWDRMSSCFVQEGFCSIAFDNREALWRVFRVVDLGHTIRVWREIVEIAVHCGRQELRGFSQWALAKLADHRN